MRNYILLFIACVLFHLVGTWSLPLIDRDEPRFAEASREMLERKDFIVPFFNNQFRFDKPPLTYWFQVASYRLFGENDFAARFPTAIAAGLVAVVLMAWGTRLEEWGHAEARPSEQAHDDRADSGLWAAVIFTLCLQTFIHGKAAVADMWLVLFVTAAHWAGWELSFGKHRTSNIEDRTSKGASRRFALLFYGSLGLAFLAKGPIGWTPLLTFAIAQCCCSRGRWPRPGKNSAETARRISQPRPATAATMHVLGGLLMLAIVCAWGIPAVVRTHGEFFSVGIGKHVIGRSLATMEGHGANSLVAYVALLPFYFVTVFVSFFPWSIRFPALWKNLRRSRDASDDFLIIGALIIFGIFTLVKTKLPHYILPAFPLLALLMARRAESLRLSRKVAWGTAIVFLAIALIAPPIVSRFVPSYALARSSRSQLKGDMEFGALGYTEPSLVWYFRRDVSGFMTTLREGDAAEYLGKTGPRFLILPTHLVTQLLPQPDPLWRSYRARGWNLAKGERVDVTMLLKNSDE